MPVRPVTLVSGRIRWIGKVRKPYTRQKNGEYDYWERRFDTEDEARAYEQAMRQKADEIRRKRKVICVEPSREALKGWGYA